MRGWALAPLAAAIVVLVVSALLPRGVFAEVVLPILAAALVLVQVVVLLVRSRRKS